jgi:hypothetical protein
MEEIEFIDAFSSGVFDDGDGFVEEGAIDILIDGKEVRLIIQQYGDGEETFLLDDFGYKELMEYYGIEFYDDEELSGPQSFLDDLHSFYDSQTK